MVSDKIRIYQRAVAIVTGGASGIGRALAFELSRRGCAVVLADLQIEMAQDNAAQIQAAGGRAKAVEVDVTDFPAMERLINETVDAYGRLDYIFNNAGIVIGCTADHYSIEDWNRIIDINLRGVVNGTHAAYKIMIAQGFGHIVNTASIAGLIPNPINVAYAATKHAVVGLSQSLRVEAAGMGIRVSALCPGVIHTPMLNGGTYGKLRLNLSAEKIREMWDELRPMPVEIFAGKALNAVAKNKAIIILPARWKIMWWFNRLSPSLEMAFIQNRFRKLQKECDS